MYIVWYSVAFPTSDHTVRVPSMTEISSFSHIIPYSHRKWYQTPEPAISHQSE